MNIREEILKEHSKKNALRIAQYIGHDPKRFAELIDCFLGQEYRVTQRAAQVVSCCADRHPELLLPHLDEILLNLRRNIHVAVKRNTLRVLQYVDLPDHLQGPAADICFKIMGSGNEPVAVKVFAMTVLANICKKEPELKNELRILIEDQMPYGSAGFISRGAKILKHL
ncbi:hypothetical protein C900_03766 [Fulvivirga imtechensis AK7]|uniref:Uncharacterized protein n=1 Tax=Fulvivirga imtechensis AK7 TaxID=1237149 RepID=L8JSS2_9BACT|nr:hypothetical protein [Fulvivirga imtechensis]ELR70412.1 hypothetical protein C900_03766 [Fulvivirga imtechensis AK7]